MRTAHEIGEIVRSLRGNTSLRDFAKKCDISHTTIDNIEKGVDFRTGKPTQVKVSTLNKIAVACNVPISYIIGSDENEKPPAEGEGHKDELINETVKLFEQLPPEGMELFQKMLRSYIDANNSQEKK